MKHLVLIGALLGLFIATGSAATPTNPPPVPEYPSIWREVTGITNSYAYQGAPRVPVHTRPHIPAFRTSTDGRVGMRVKGSPQFALLMPEKLTQPAMLSPAGSYIMSSTNYWFLSNLTASASAAYFLDPPANSTGSISHSTMYDSTGPTGTNTNPKVVNNEDVYDLTILAIYNFSRYMGTNIEGIQIFSTPVQITVTNAKTTGAVIRSITRKAPPTAGPVFYNCEGFEPMVAGDGRLFVFRIGGGTARTWINPNSGTNMPADRFDICYSYYTNGAAADVTKWTNLIPITYAPYDSRIYSKFGFAMAPFRDAEGTLIPPGEDIGGTYPWIDRAARNLFFTAVGETLHYATFTTNGSTITTNWNNSRYPQTGTPEETPTYIQESASKTRGCCVVGLWTHGKVVLFDNLNNDMDYAVSDESNPIGAQRLVNFFQPNTGPYGNETNWLRLGAGRINNQLPAGENQNGTIMDSLENIFNYRPHFVPTTLRDVVWPFSNGKQSDDLAFDDYVDPDAFVIANMSGLLNFDLSATNTTASRDMQYSSGWNSTNKSFNLPVRFQNAATAPTNRWRIPKHGQLIGRGRLEPAAGGGFHGKGLWLTGTNGLQFAVTNQPQSISAKDWYVGIFVDCRFADDAVERRLLTFPDATAVWLRGRNQVLYRDAAGSIVHRVTVPPPIGTNVTDTLDDLLPDRGWAHLAFQVREAGGAVDFHLNGLLYNRWRDNYTTLFQFTPGNLTIGQTSTNLGNGFTGWVDDFKVFAHAVDFETAANHAGGTLIGLPANYTGIWKSNFANRYPSWAHQEVSAVLGHNGETNLPSYAVFMNYWTDKSVHKSNIPPGSIWLRQAVHFPEGPLFHDAPRPHSAANAFCLTCHHTAADGGLDLTAITLDGSLTASADARRQPMQPFRRVFGRIPAGLVPSTGQPTTAQNLGLNGKIIDEWTMASFSNSVTVKSFSLLESGTGRELAVLTNGMLLDPARLGTSNWTIRANLDTAQGLVSMNLDGGANNTKPRPPYTLAGNSNNPYAAAMFTAGPHTVNATPSLGALTSLSFNVATAATARVVANFQQDYRTHAPLPGWTYEWNADGSVSNRGNYRFLAWSTVHNRYTADGGASFPVTSTNYNAHWLEYGGFRPNGLGNPGNGATAGGGHERYAIAGYRVKRAGYYAIGNSLISDNDANGNGCQLIVFTDTAGNGTLNQISDQVYNAGGSLTFDGNVGYLNVDDTIFVCIGPRGNDGSDLYTLTYQILYRETGNPF
jgi:hypothetical protein